TPTHTSTVSLHDALPISGADRAQHARLRRLGHGASGRHRLSRKITAEILDDGDFVRHFRRARLGGAPPAGPLRDRPLLAHHPLISEEHTSELQSPYDLVC